MHDLQGVTRRRPRRRSDQRGERAERRRMRGGKDDVCVCVVCVLESGGVTVYYRACAECGGGVCLVCVTVCDRTLRGRADPCIQ